MAAAIAFTTLLGSLIVGASAIPTNIQNSSYEHVHLAKRVPSEGFLAGTVSWTSGNAIATLDNDVDFYFQGDANLVIRQGNEVLWASYPPGTRDCSNGKCSLVYQGDGNFVAYDNGGNAFWSTGTNSYSGHEVASAGLFFSNSWPWIQLYSGSDSLMWRTSQGGSGSTSYNPGAPAPQNSNGLRYCNNAPDGWGDGSPVCVSGVSTIEGEYTTVMNAFNNQYCNGDWSGSISVHSAAITDGGLTFSITNLPQQPGNIPYDDLTRQPIDCSKIQSFFAASPENLIGCGQFYSYSCDYSPNTVTADSTWQYTASLYVSSDEDWVLGGRDGQPPPPGSGTSSIAARGRSLATEGTYFIQCGGGVSCTSDGGGFILI